MQRPPMDTLMNRKNESLRWEWRAVEPRGAGLLYAADSVDSAPCCAHRRAEERKEKGEESRSMVVITSAMSSRRSHGQPRVYYPTMACKL